ncbi:MAG: hypothetical protein QOI66_2744 [Myxococcales bacterium]|jgi:folate-binding protein YgfZ|nr:hypothetical protein [Myxococcales bacterium]
MSDRTDVEALDALTSDAATVDLGPDQPMGQDLVVATGADRIRFLHGLVTGNVAGTPVGGGARSVLLTTKGHVVGDLHIFVRPDDVWMVVPAGQGDSIAEALSRYAIMDDFAAAPRPDFRFLAVLGPGAAPRLGAAGVGSGDVLGDLGGRPLLSHVSIDAGALWLVRARALGVDGFWVGGAADAVAAVGARLGQAGVARLPAPLAEAARIAAGEPRWGAEITPDYFPMEVGLSAAIDYGKGCYLGQEPIVRIRDRGHINWRLVGLDLDDAAGAGGDPAPGDALEADAKPRAGRITSAARLPDGRGVALALLHVSVPAGSKIRIKHGDGLLTASVRGDAGP